MKFFKSLTTSLLYFIILNCCYSQDPVWPINETVFNYNQISTTFAEKHAAFHGALDLFVVNNTEYLAILNGIISDDADGSGSGNLFMVTNHEFETEGNLESNFKMVRYGDDVDPLDEIENGDIINSNQAIGTIISGGHLHFEMWVRDCIMGCDWYLVDPLNNANPEYENLPLGEDTKNVSPWFCFSRKVCLSFRLYTWKCKRATKLVLL